MSNSIQISKEKTSIYHGIFNIKELYNEIINFLEESEFMDVSIKEYVEQNQKGKRKINTYIIADKELDDYFKVNVKLFLEASGKIILNPKFNNDPHFVEGDAQINVNSYIIHDWQNEFDNSFLSKLNKFLFGSVLHVDKKNKAAGEASATASRILKKFKTITSKYAE